MRVNTAIPILLLISLSTSAVCAGQFGFGAGYCAGFTVTDMEVEKYHYGTNAIIFDVSNEIPIKSSMKNFGLWGVYNFEPYIGIEYGMTFLSGYFNESAQLLGGFGYDNYSDDDFEWRGYSFEFGGRYVLISSGVLRPFLDGGLTLTLSQVLHDETRNNAEDKAKTFGYYVGGGCNFQISDHIAITAPVKYRSYSTVEHTRTIGGDEVNNFSVYYKPAALLTVGAGIEYYL